MNGLNQYKRAQMDTVSPEDSVALVYDGARRFVDLAATALEAKRYDEVSRYTGKAQQILAELSAALNFEAGEMAQNLFRLYEYWGWRLSEGLIKQNPEAFQEVSRNLQEMRDAWAEASKQVRVQRSLRASG